MMHQQCPAWSILSNPGTRSLLVCPFSACLPSFLASVFSPYRSSGQCGQITSSSSPTYSFSTSKQTQCCYDTQKQLDRHKQISSCRQSLPPEPKRRKTTKAPVKAMYELPPVQESELSDVIRENWGPIRTHTNLGSVQTRYNYRLMTLVIHRPYKCDHYGFRHISDHFGT